MESIPRAFSIMKSSSSTVSREASRPGHWRRSGCVAAPGSSDPFDAGVVQLPHRQLGHVLAPADDGAASSRKVAQPHLHMALENIVRCARFRQLS